MSPVTSPAIVVGSGVNALGITRSLGRHHIPVHCLGKNKHQLAFRSRYCTRAYAIPRIEQHTQLRRALMRLYKDFPTPSQPPVLFPTSDTSVYNVAQILQECKNFVSPIPRLSIVELLINKQHFYQRLDKEGILHPQTRYLHNTQLDDILPDLAFPVFLKPTVSQPFFSEFRTKGFIVHNPTQLKSWLQATRAKAMEMMIQQYIFGPTTNCYVFNGFIDRTATLRTLVARRKIREPTLTGSSSCSVSIPLSKVTDMASTLLNFFATIGYTGLFDAAFKRDIRDNRAYFFEVNPRTGLYNSHLPACGVNHVYMAYQDACRQDVATHTRYRTGVYCIDVIRDVASRDFMKTPSTVMASYSRRPHWPIYASDDPLPWVHRVAIEKKGTT